MDEFKKTENFYKDIEQAWKAIFKLSDRTRFLEKFTKSQSVLNILFFLFITGLIISQVILYAEIITR